MTISLWTALILQLVFKVSAQSACGNESSVAVCSCRTNFDGTWTVNCSGLGLRTLPVGIPINTSYLYAERNNLTDIDDDTLQSLPHLKHIFLNFNKLSTLPKFPKGIRFISATNNNIQSIDGSFEDLTMLTGVNLESNRVNVIKNTAFKDSTYLSYLKMKKCKIEEIQPNTFTRLSKLSFIDIKSNYVNSIKEDVFLLNGSSPCDIQLKYAGVENIATGSFRNLGNSSSIYLMFNSIRSIPSRAFRAHFLLHIDISFNGLQHIDPEAFAEVGSVWNLYLDRNELTEIPLGLYILNVRLCLRMTLNSIDLSSQPNRSVIVDSAKEILLAKNNIRYIFKNHFCQLESLEVIFLYHNEISYIEGGSFSGTSLRSM
ncbi:leucine-rich repeats and immunoglobulin-like domains protein 1 [Anneissia japonica]|uniref:leucine-rich repeats and immunoglobulin-like domains protein 1 n=1 Tax=Anneissia japonica TaxID=1529436 RepID=UPI0014254B6D|nr:leucine-rich repeats and immunoglobulin-like domains protein 1 [Anneissia japonica]